MPRDRFRLRLTRRALDLAAEGRVTVALIVVMVIVALLVARG